MIPPGRPGNAHEDESLSAQRERRALRRLVPAPLLSLLLFTGWLALNGSASAGHVVLGAALALAIPWFTERLRASARPPPRCCCY